MKDIKNEGILIGNDNVKEPKLINYDPESKNNIMLAVSGSGINLNEEMGKKQDKRIKKLMINGKPAKVGQEVTTCRGKAILLDWSYFIYDDTGEVIIKEVGNEYAQIFSLSAIGIDGEFV